MRWYKKYIDTASTTLESPSISVAWRSSWQDKVVFVFNFADYLSTIAPLSQ